MELRTGIAHPRQLTLGLEPSPLQGLPPRARGEVVALLAYLLLEASGKVERKADDERS